MGGWEGRGEGMLNTSSLYVTTCSQLQDMDENLTEDYFLNNSINCSYTDSWNSGDGFDPVGDSGDKFLGNLEGVEKMPLKDGGERYLIKCFIYTTNDYTNRKFVFDLKVNKEDGFIDINRIYFGNSQNPVLERVPISERGSLLYRQFL